MSGPGPQIYHRVALSWSYVNLRGLCEIKGARETTAHVESKKV